MTKQYSYFRFDGTLESARSAIEDAAGIQLSERESSYYGGTYFRFKDTVSDFELMLHCNIDRNGDWIDPEFAGTEILCSIHGPVTVASAYLEKLENAGGLLLASRTRENEGD